MFHGIFTEGLFSAKAFKKPPPNALVAVKQFGWIHTAYFTWCVWNRSDISAVTLHIL